MKKELLTIDNIKQDLRVDAKNHLKELCEVLAAFTVSLALIIVCVALIPNLSLFLKFIVCCALEAAFLVLLIKSFKKVVMLYKALKNDIIIVTDKLIHIEIKVKSFGRKFQNIRTFYYFHFSQYGIFEVPNENYKWSETFSMSRHGVSNYAKDGDEFYLVLSKQHTGKILFAYNKKMFEMN